MVLKKSISPIETKVLVIGAGPVGLFSVFMCGMVGLKCCVIDSLDHVGGQCQALYPDKPIYDIPCFPDILARDMVSRLETQIQPFAPRFFLENQVKNAVQASDGRWHVHTSTGQEFLTNSVIICAGSGSFVPKRPPLERLEEFEGASIFYSVKNKKDLMGKDVVIAGGGDSAVDWALLLQPLVKSLHIVHRRDRFTAQDHSYQRLKSHIDKGTITFHSLCQLDTLHGQNGILEGIRIAHKNGSMHEIQADILLPFFGLQSDLGPIGQWGLDIHNQRICIDPTTGTTNKPGIYAAGDIATYPHKLKLIMTGFAEVAQIAHHLKRYLFPGQFFSFKHSTSSGIPRNLI
jgi:thioredoxin reductase (NADPH)